MSPKNVAMMCDHVNLFDRAGVAVATAAVQDFGLVTEDKEKYAIDKSKVRRERKKFRKDIQEKEAGLFCDINGLHVNGRKDASMVMSEVRDKYYPSVELEEHCVPVGEEGVFYLSQVTTEDETDRGIAMCMYSEIKRTSLENNL